MSALQRGFTTLADAVLEEMDTVRAEAQRWQSERDGWAASMEALNSEVRSKLAEADARIAIADATRAEVASLRETLRSHVEARITICQEGLQQLGATVEACRAESGSAARAATAAEEYAGGFAAAQAQLQACNPRGGPCPCLERLRPRSARCAAGIAQQHG